MPRFNPVRAAMVEDPAHYRWTSYRANALGQCDALLTPHPVYLALDTSVEKPMEAYRGLFRPYLEREAIAYLRLALKQSQPLGDQRFHARIERMVGEPRQVRPCGRPRKEGDVQIEGRDQGDLEFKSNLATFPPAFPSCFPPCSETYDAVLLRRGLLMLSGRTGRPRFPCTPNHVSHNSAKYLAEK